ncbi:alpha-amylase family glycosyl hydrolase [Labilithrix luteola]|uniref:alpha-amylase family glycosyl hydrolase n=1 Tax=Labilithrix luteola TaxID=1391654 RepID=UPI001475C471|nr:alpha-amylase family glycosyl hydrolase [Labilithrix luteola]
MTAQPKLGLGVHPDEGGTTFVVWTTNARQVGVRLFDEQGNPLRTERLDARGDGRFEGRLEGVSVGALYKFVLDDEEVPDPYARWLPLGVHGPARITKRGRAEPLLDAPLPSGWVVYELHIGTFTPQGTYRAAEDRLDHIADLGFTAIELLPVAAFPGARGWGYDGVAPFAPYAGYGSPDELRAFVRAAHRRGLAVILDVVYDHFGPAGSYLTKFASEYFTGEPETGRGPVPDFTREPMRRLVLDNARYWLDEFGFDALRIESAHAMRDPSQLHVLRAITGMAHSLEVPRRVFFHDERSDPDELKALGADGVWASDFQRQLHVLLTQDHDGDYANYEGTLAAIAETVNEGWIGTGISQQGERSRRASPRARGLTPESLVYCLQNHEDVGNRAFGTRLTADVDIDAFCVASAFLLFLPATPLVFMGQEWAASSPFPLFSDHDAEFGDAVRTGRREKFQSFATFAEARMRDRIPDPQARSTFESARLHWEERWREPHTRVLGTYRALLQLRAHDPVLSAACAWADLRATVHGDVLEVVRARSRFKRRLLLNFGGEEIDLRALPSLSSVEQSLVLFTRGRFQSGHLGARAVAILAE